MEVRIAQDSEGKDILELFPKSELMNPADWERVFPYWAVAVIDGEIIGALQMCPSLPIGRIEHLNLKPDLNKITATKAAYALIKYTELAMIRMGCSVIAGYVEFRNKPIKKLVQKQFKAQVIGSGSMLAWRL
tara:strand:- start:1033 stop:1428 length:396 start_codon:yes stop_codon:yes gene_type:complete